MTQVAAHRGGSQLAPENTLGAFRASHERFAGIWLEMDVRPSATGELVVIHDHVLDRTTSGSGLVSRRTPEELQEVDAAARFDGWGFEPVPLLRDVLREGAPAGWKILLEIKNLPGDPDFDPSGANQVESLVRMLSMTDFPIDRLEVISFWPPTLDRVKAELPQVPVGFLSAPERPQSPGAGLSALAAAQICADRGYEMSGSSHATPDLVRETVKRIQAMGVRVSVWTPNTPSEIARMLDAGVDRITSDRPDLVRDALCDRSDLGK